MTRQQIEVVVAAMQKQSGFYIATDVSVPGYVAPLAVIAGKIYSMRIDSERDPKDFLLTARISGPYPATPPI